ncbi:hypothetical protein E1286_43900 [Nonomuraea terrae]|uniref:Uncharacterized protein n=1 Tax=Nonomuraea terrae TaxID=2530383 RepID=A0A4R4XMX6_9ACTN|nr:hypothetical protein [Nonomuraea terrae]TDD32199.1 hypothetical protein E1286_43900 [Nonomuraea terrae]
MFKRTPPSPPQDKPPASDNGSGGAQKPPGLAMSNKVAIALIIMGGCIALVALKYDPLPLVEAIVRPLLK